MNTRLFAAAVCVAACAGCNTANLISDRFGSGNEEKLAQLADAGGPDTPKLPPPNNRDPRPDTEGGSAVDEQVRLGEEALRDQKLSQAQSHFEQALIAQPQHAKANHRMAVVCDKLGQYERAEQHYLLALQHDPRNVAVLSDLGYSYWLQKRYSESERYLQEARHIDPNYETAIANLGMLYGTTGRTDEAVALFRQIGDEGQVQQIMQQVNALAARNTTPKPVAGPMTPASLASSDPPQPSRSPEAASELKGVNEPTRELLELMEQGRRQQQQRSGAVEPAAWAANAAQTHPAVPPFAQHRQPAPQQPAPQMAGVNPFHNSPPAVRRAGPSQVPDHLLNQALAQIDREGRTPAPGAISIGPPRHPQRPPADSASPQSVAGATRPYDSTTNIPPQSFPPAAAGAGAETISAGPYYPLDADRDRAPPTSHPWPAADIPSQQIAAGSQPLANKPAAQASGTHGPSSGETFAWTESLPVPQTAPILEDWARGTGAVEPLPPTNRAFAPAQRFRPDPTEGVQQASASHSSLPEPTWSGQPAVPQQRPVEHAYHEQQPGSAAPIDLLRGQMAATGWNAGNGLAAAEQAASGSDGDRAQNAAAVAKPVDPYQEARRQAAMMGLSAGTGQLFPYMHHTMRAAPGSDSRWNGAQYPPPERSLPSGMSPAELAPAFQYPQAANLTTGENQLGQAMPTVAVPVSEPEHYHAVASGAFPPPQRQTPAAVPSNPLAAYDDVRRQQSNQLNGMIRQTYGQAPQSPPYSRSAPQSQFSGAAASPSAPGNFWDLPPVEAPAATHPSGPGAYPAGAAASTGQTAPRAASMSAVVIPEPYRQPAGGSPDIVTEPTSAQRYPADPATGGGPVIVPKYR